MQAIHLHDGKFLTIRWDENTRIISIEWKESSAAMTDENFKADLTLFAGHVEQRRARGILVDVSRFRHTLGPGLQEWRVKNISSRYDAAGVRRFAFLFPPGAQIPRLMNQSSEGENFLTRAFTSQEQAVAWLVP
jgi:hypothetical protein